MSATFAERKRHSSSGAAGWPDENVSTPHVDLIVVEELKIEN